MWGNFTSQDDKIYKLFTSYNRVEIPFYIMFFLSQTSLGYCDLFPGESQYNHLMRNFRDVLKDPWWIYLVEYWCLWHWLSLFLQLCIHPVLIYPHGRTYHHIHFPTCSMVIVNMKIRYLRHGVASGQFFVLVVTGLNHVTSEFSFSCFYSGWMWK